MFRKDEPEINLQDILERVRSFLKSLRLGGGGILPKLIVLLFIVALVGWFATGLFTVGAGEQAALRLLGRFTDVRGPGLQWWWPTPIGAHDVVRMDEVRRLELGIRGDTPVLSESLMITGDPDDEGGPGEAPNIVDAQLLIQYNVKDIENFLFRVVAPDTVTIKDAAENSLRQVVGSRPIDDVLTDKKEDVQAETKERLQNLLDDYETGLAVREVKLLNVFAPEQVKDAFDDVVRAKEDKARIINLADAYKEDILPRARGDAARVIFAAEAFRQQKVAEATGQAERFLAILGEYRQSKDVTRKRLYLEAMETILPGITKVLGDPGEVILVSPNAKVLPIPVSTDEGSP